MNHSEFNEDLQKTFLYVKLLI